MDDARASGEDGAADLALLGRPGLFRITPVARCARFVLRGGEAAIGAVANTLSLELLGPVNRATSGEACAALRLGPDDWLLVGAPAIRNTLQARVVAAAAAHACALVDVSDRSLGLHVTGPGATDALASGCPQDLGDAAFPVGKCSRTVFAQASILLWREDAQTWRLETERSFMPYVVTCLARETVPPHGEPGAS